MLPASYKDPGRKVCCCCKYFGDGRDYDDEGFTVCLRYAPPQADFSTDRHEQYKRFQLYVDDLGRDGFSIEEYGTCDEWESGW